ncbi:glycosyltransferase [Aurantimonas sp. 22II-16-19i]|uniref:glycosyltransferase n=1 Tax=Aurantimonas sp. 22II-16-19i TaxID=1317114 RepID=UPI0009F7B0AE|nr:glycosyltransferase [Aurantimonas sp. 22II-16-19i]ORE97478.1 group 1 glycosyl transferase [Aurantimonas sp. 22II-16-19i]
MTELRPNASAEERDASIDLRAADQLRERGDFVAAKAAYEALLAHGERAVLRCRLGDIALRDGELETAKTHFAAAIAADARFVWGHFGRARASARLGRTDEAIAACATAVALEPDRRALTDFLTTLLGQRDPATDSQARAGPDTEAFRQLQFRLADELANARKFTEAASLLVEMKGLYGASPALLCKLGNALTGGGKPLEALECFAQAQALSKDFVWTYVGRAEALKALLRHDEALVALDEAHRLLPGSQPIGQRRAELQLSLRNAPKDDKGPTLRCWPAEGERTDAPPGRPRINVIAWDLGHNPVGRAAVLAEIAAGAGAVELVGPLFPRYGGDLWPPLAGSTRKHPIRGFACGDLASFVNGALRLVMEHPCDIAWISKARFPSLFIGLLYKLVHGARLILDIDDDELAFVDAAEPLGIAEFVETAEAADWDAPYGRRWTQLAAGLIGDVDYVTTCNPVLQARHGGSLVRHARDEQLFADAAAARAGIRHQFALHPEDKVVLFLGTPRRHKGLLEIASALEMIADPRLVLCVIGSFTEADLEKELRARPRLRLILLPDQPMDKVAEFNAMADIVCLLQDPESRIAASQTPAKLTDALASGTQVIATAVAPIADLVEPGHIITVPDGRDIPALAAAIRQACAADDAAKGAARQAFFRQALSVQSHVPAMKALVDRLSEAEPTTGDLLAPLLSHIRDAMPGTLSPAWHARMSRSDGWQPKVRPLRRLDEGVNLVFFWKQNDTGLYGRRHDMLLAELARMPSIRRILQIDAPISVDVVQRQLEAARANPLNGARHVVGETVQRFLQNRDTAKVFRRSFIHAGQTKDLLGQSLPDSRDFPRHVERWIAELGMRDNALAWVCPVVPQFPQVQEHIGFSFVVSDVIDDQREWPVSPEQRQALQDNYDRTFAATDVALANCQAVADWLRLEGLATRMVPNGADSFPGVLDWEIPDALVRLPRPIIGYSGNLGDRIDWDLIAAVADARPDWSIVLIGAIPRMAEAGPVLARRNVAALGVVPYEQAVRHIAAFDAAMIPHRDSGLTQRMNPLKLYVYRALGVPVVTTAIANIDDLSNDVLIGRDPADFIARLDTALIRRAEHGRDLPDPAKFESLQWPQRMREIMAHVTEVFESSRTDTKVTPAM